MGISCKKYIGANAGTFSKLDKGLAEEKKRAYRFEQVRTKKLESKKK